MVNALRWMAIALTHMDLLITLLVAYQARLSKIDFCPSMTITPSTLTGENGELSIPHVLRVAVEVAGLSVLLLLLRHGMLSTSVLYLSSPNSILSTVIPATLAVTVDGLLPLSHF